MQVARIACSKSFRRAPNGFMNSHYNLPGTRERVLWPAAALCAFIASGLEIFSFSHYLLLRPGATESAGSPPDLHPGIIHTGFMVAVIGLIAEATALWGIGKRQRAVAPISARLGQWCVAIYVVVSGVLFVVGTFGGWFAGALGSWSFPAARVPVTLAFGCLGWASRGGTPVTQRWASRALLIVTAVGVFSLIRNLSGLSTGQGWPWFALLHALLHAFLRSGMWSAVGTWLRRPQSADGYRDTTVRRAGRV